MFIFSAIMLLKSIYFNYGSFLKAIDYVHSFVVWAFLSTERCFLKFILEISFCQSCLSEVKNLHGKFGKSARHPPARYDINWEHFPSLD